jgi:hypothetical protein
MLKQFNLPNFIDGLTFADASKKIQSRFKERTDPESVNTEREMLDRLKQMQEYVKAQKESKEAPERSEKDIIAGSQEQNLLDESALQEDPEASEEDLMSQIQSAYGGNQYSFGGDIEVDPVSKRNLKNKVLNSTGIEGELNDNNMAFDTKQIVRYQPGVTSGQTGKKGFYLYSKNAGEPGFDPSIHREFVNQEEMMAVQRTPQWKSYMENQSKMALGGNEEDLHFMPETTEKRFAPTISANNSSIGESIMSLAGTSKKIASGESTGVSLDGASGGSKEGGGKAEDAMGIMKMMGMMAFGGVEDDYYKNNNPYFTTNPGQVTGPQTEQISQQPKQTNQVQQAPTNNPNVAPQPAKENDSIISGMGKTGPMGYAQLGITAFELGKEAFGPTGVDTSGAVHVEKKKAGNAALAGAAKGAQAGMVLGPWGAAGGAVIGAAAGFVGAKKQQKDAAIANRNATYADAAVNDNQFAEGGEEEKISIKDGRKVRATTRQRINPNVDLVSGNYSAKTITDIVNASLKNGVDPNTAIALAMQESKLGNVDENLGRIVGGSYRGEEANDMTKLLFEKMNTGRKLGRKTDEELLQMYNGTGKIFPSTEEKDHGFKMKKAYGVPVGKKGIDMGKTNLYGIQVKDIRDNVIKKDKKVASMVKKLSENFNHFEGMPYKNKDPRTHDDPLGIAEGARNNLNPKMFALGGEEMNEFKEGGNLIAGKINKKTNKRESLSSVGTLTPAELKKTEKIFKGKDATKDSLLNLDNYIEQDKIGLINLPDLGKKKAEKITTLQRMKLAGMDVADFVGENKDALRYAPALGNIMQLANLKKPEQETTPELNTRYKKNIVDENGLSNLVREETASNREAILASSEGSGNAARANLLATQLNSMKGLSDAFMKSQEANARENAQEQSFNLGIDTTNLQQQTLAQEIRARNKGAYDTEKSRLQTAIAADLGSVGQEELYKKFPELMGASYDWKGKYKKLKQESDS